jgi:hypothetical protein
MRQRKYEVFNGITEEHCRSVPLTKAKVDLDQQVKDAEKNVLQLKTRQSIMQESNQKKSGDPSR